MNLYLRLFWLILRRMFVLDRSDAFDPCSTKFRVGLLDLDVNLHMNNGRYLSLMDLGRIDLMLKAEVFWKLLKRGYYPVVASESIRFKKSLEPFQCFILETKIESWDEKDFFMTQKFLHRDSVVAVGYIRGRFKQRGRKGSVPTSEIFEIIGREYQGPQVSDLAEVQIKIDSCLNG